MATHSGGAVDWAAVIKPISGANYTPLSQAEALVLVRAILRSEAEILSHDEAHELFYMSFSALAAHSISGQYSSITKNHTTYVTEASAVLIQYILDKLNRATITETKLLLPALKSLALGQCDEQDTDLTLLMSLLKNSTLPEHQKAVVAAPEKDTSKSETKRFRSDLSAVILQQLTAPLGSTQSAQPWNLMSDEPVDFSQAIIKSNMDVMESLNAGSTILRVCTNLPFLAKNFLRYEDSIQTGKPLFLPVLQADATSIKTSLSQIATYISILSTALQMPLLDPLDPSKIEQLSRCAMHALYSAVVTSVAISVLHTLNSSSNSSSGQPGPTKTTTSSSTAATGGATSAGAAAGPSGTEAADDSSDDEMARIIVDKSLEVFNNIGALFNTTQAHIYQNHLCIGAWLLLSGIQGAMNASGNAISRSEDSTSVGSKGKSPSRTTDGSGRVNFSKVQQGFRVMNATIANQCLAMLTELVQNLQIESRSDVYKETDAVPDAAGFDVLGQYTALQRIVRVLNVGSIGNVPTMQQLLTFLATISYRKACSMKRVNVKTDGEPVSYSDSTTYFNDSMSCSEGSESDEEDDSYLGIWFKETFSPELKEPSAEENQEKTNENQRSAAAAAAASKNEPHEYLELSAKVFTFLDTVLNSNHKYLHRHVKAGLSEQQMVLLANILKDLDRDALRGEPESVSQLQISMASFSSAIGRYMHNLISMGLITESLQSTLLLHLGVSPWAQETSVWPLQVYSRTLSVLVQILLLKPPMEKEAACLSVWHRLVNTLVDGVCSQADGEYEDLNVEHAQLLLFLFHSLNLMQKKSILLLTAGGVIRCADVCRGVTTEKTLRYHQIVLLSRLLLFLEYLMKHLYNPPTVLLEQVRWNLFSTVTMDPKQKSSDAQNTKTKIQFCRKDLEEKYRKHSLDSANSIRPKFYSLTTLDTKVQQEFKLDGLAWNFILCTPDKLRYPLLIDALVDILAVVDQCAALKTQFHTMCAVNYVFSLCWKLLLGLPPSTPHVEALMQDTTPNLHMLLWSVRCMHAGASSNYLIVNSLVKQGMYTQFAESLWTNITKHVSDVQFRMTHTILGLQTFNKSFSAQNPSLSKIVFLDAIVAHLYVFLWADKENGTKAKNAASSLSTSTSSEISATGTAADTMTYFQLNTQTTTPTEEETDASITQEFVSRDLLSKLLDALDAVRDSIFRQMSTKLKGLVPDQLMESLLSLSGSKNPLCVDIVQQFSSLMSCHKNTFEWTDYLSVASDTNFQTATFPVELHTLTVIEAHLAEVFRNSVYTILPSLKHTLMSMLNLLYYLLPVCKTETTLADRVKSQLVPLLYDIRTEFLWDVTSKCLTSLLDGDAESEQYQFLTFTNVLRHSYKLIIDFTSVSAMGKSTNCPETVLHNVLKTWETMLDKPVGLKAMHEFFVVKKTGNLVHVLLCFTNTNFSQLLSTKVLQFFDKLFQSCDKPNSVFKLDALCSCVSELETIDVARLKVWLSHILLGPGSVNTALSVTSAASSNVQTPTNMATNSAIPSISDQQPSIPPADPNAMDIDFECSAYAGLIEDPTYCVWHAGCTNTLTTTNQSGTDTPNEECIEKNGRLLHLLVKYVVAECRIAPTVAASLFQALIQLGPNLLSSTQESIQFTDVLQVMITLANSGQGKGHATMFAAVVEWLDISRSHVLELALNDKSTVAFENVSALMRYLCDLLQGLGFTGSRAHLPPWDDEALPEFDDYNEDQGIGPPGDDEEDSAIDDSDEDSLGSRLCTYSFTQKEFMNQHWYHCYTCKMVDGAGVCSVCARVCHKNHDISYAKYGNFFCDCGAKEDGSCQALNKRVNTNSDANIGHKSTGATDKTSALRSSESVPRNHQRSTESSKLLERSQHLAKMIELSRESLKNSEQWKSVVRSTLEFFDNMMQAVQENCAKYSTVGCHQRAKNALKLLHQPNKRYNVSNKMMVATLGSQEGAFENVRSNYIGEQSQTIRQLILSNMVRRVGLCCLSSSSGKRQHLAVSHEKGKITILQLSALLKQADAPKKKLTLSRLSSAPIPCTVMSLEANAANEDLLAVCGLKECHILTFTSGGIASEHIVITPQLDTGNYIKRAVWLPGSQTMLALITCDYVKIYELSKDTFSPQYYFLVPSGKIRDCTFVYQAGTYFLLLFASSGYIYTQPLVDESLAKHGAFYVTNTLEIDHALVVDVKGSLAEGGASIYYSHVLQMLFFSYCSGCSFMAPLTDVNEGVKYVMLLQTSEEFGFPTLNKSPSKLLMQWSEVAGHPGLVFAMVNQTNNPIVFMIKPDGYLLQEIKYGNIKSKIMDMVAIRHTTGGQERTTLLLLCEDGSLRIYAANTELTSYWLSPEVQPLANHLYQSYNPKTMRRLKKKSSNISNANNGLTKSATGGANNSAAPNAPLTFPIDFFEDCTLFQDVEFGGNDLLQVYNTQQLKHRLNSTGLYVVSTKPSGFKLEVHITDQNYVITGVRILIGTQDPLRAPQSVTILTRTVTTVATRPRWFDIPFSREETIEIERNLVLTFGPSQDYEHICMLDSIKVYTKTKEAFGWPDESDEATGSAALAATAGQIPEAAGISISSGSADLSSHTLIPMDNMLISMLEVLDCGLSLLGGTSVEEPIKKKSIEVATNLLIRPLPAAVQSQSKSVLATLIGNRVAYNAFKDQEIMKEVATELEKLKAVEIIEQIDPKAFFRLVMLTRGIAISRPNSLAKYASEKQFAIVESMMQLIQQLYAITPRCELQSSIVKIGLAHTEATIHYLVEIIFAFALSDPTSVDTMTAFFVDLLLNESSTISHSAKHAMVRLLRPRSKNRHNSVVTPPTCLTPVPSGSGILKNIPPHATRALSNAVPSGAVGPAAAAAAAAAAAERFAEAMQDLNQQFGEVGDDEETAAGAVGGYAVPIDADEDAIIEMAIALSLQEHEGDLQALQQDLANMRGGDAFSGPASDDEGSNAATDGSNLRTSPAEPAGSGGSESGGSGVESIACTSGRSSTYGGDQTNASPPRQEQQRPTVVEVPEETVNDSSDKEQTHRLHVLRTTILLKMVDNLATIDTKKGHQAIPFMQVLLMLTADLDVSVDLDQRAMSVMLSALIDRLDMRNTSNTSQMLTRSSKTEVQCVILRLLSVLMGKIKSSSSKGSSSTTNSGTNVSNMRYNRSNSQFVAYATANALNDAGSIPYCLAILKSFLHYWVNAAANNEEPSTSASVLVNGGAAPVANSGMTTQNVLKLQAIGPELDLQPFFGPSFNGKHSAEAFDQYQMNITEIAVRLPYQILKLTTDNPKSSEYLYEQMSATLCEYMMAVQSPLLRRIIRKLLLFICGNKEQFRQTRDIHWLNTHINIIRKHSETAKHAFRVSGGALPNTLSYDALVELTEHLRACLEVASVRRGNWQRFCLQHIDVLPLIMGLSTSQLAEGVSPVILQLLQGAICILPADKNDGKVVKARQDRDKSEDADAFPDSKFDPNQCAVLVSQIFTQVSPGQLTKFIKTFLLETNITSIRWQAHGLIYAFYEYSGGPQKERLLNCMWDLWPQLPAYGRRTAQFVDLLGYLTLNTKQISNKLPEYMELAVSVLRLQNERLSRHPNAPIYTQLSQVLELEGFYLESEPCLVCNNPEVPMANIKLSSIKIDSKFTTTTTIVKLSQSHTISKIVLRIAELKRAKMVRAINIYYNNRSVQAVVELKNRPAMWHKARKVILQSGQTDVKIEFPLPITACNLMIEYADFYETQTGSSENLQCPRCSAAVPANPGVCANCGENVFQCHKCRAINYDEKDPFLCHSCGFCKYAKFDYNIFGRACCAVDPIESGEDRAKTVQTIHNSLEKADRVYRVLQTNKQILELLVQKMTDQKLDRSGPEEAMIGGNSVASQVNKVIQLLAQKYCVESKNSFEDLSKVIQKVQACRRELVAYDRSQVDGGLTTAPDGADVGVSQNRCYGCALASTEQCLTLLRAMASNVDCRLGLCNQGLVEELAQNNLRRGTFQIQDEVRQLLCLLTRDLPDATASICQLILNRVKMALSGIVPLANIDAAVRHEMALLESLVAVYDTCWEQKTRVVMEIFLLACRDTRGLPVAVLQPSLKIIESLICPPPPKSKTNKDQPISALYTVQSVGNLTVDYRQWLKDDPTHSFEAWRSRMPTVNKPIAKPIADTPSEPKPIPPNRQQKRANYLAEKYANRWRLQVLSKGIQHEELQLTASWLQPILFNTNSRIGRQLATSLVPTLINKNNMRKRELLDLLTGFLRCIGDAGEASEEFLILYRCLAEDTPWRQYLVLKQNVLLLITELLAVEIEKIHRLEDTTLSSDLAQGYALRQLVELLAMFLDNPKIRQVYKGKLLGPVLQGYLQLRKLVVQRTRLVDDAQEKLLEMLEEMTTGTEAETRAFMSVLIDTVCKTSLNDIKTPVFIFERLCSIIHPEENDVGEFFLTLEKDAQQEDFLQGRMLGNPYPSTEAGLGPLMRDVKNKICMDCELIALLEDDNGMELLVYNKIISLDLPVKEVYKKVWLAEGGERDTMRVVYRMRGLLGDATEEFIETLNKKATEEVDNEQLYRMANVLADECGGLQVMLDRIASLQNVSRSRSLLQVLLKLFLLAVKVRRCQEVLCQPELGAINTLLKVLQMCLQTENDSQLSAVTEQLLEIMETILSKAASDTLDTFLQFSLTFGGPEYVTALISCTNCSNVRNSPSVLRHLIRVLAALVYGNDLKMALLCDHFHLDFESFDADHSNEDEFRMDLFCVLTNQIEHNSIGGTLKDYIMGLGIVDKSLAYFRTYAPCVKPTLLRVDSDELKEFITRPSLTYILRFLTGLSTQHEATQLAIAKDIIPIIHRLEQVSSDEHVGTLAENLLEALCTDPVTAKRVQEVRDFTRAEKKRLAMATREKQLDALGMRTNDKGQVTAKGALLQTIEKLREETGLTCFICREGYACQPTKVLGIYTFTKRTNLDEFELKIRKSLGYTTVTYFNVVHIDCHMAAIRLARGRDEWESASLQNANTRCNGLLPLFGPEVEEPAFAAAMTRHNANMQESTQRCEITFVNAIHDLKLLLLRFAQEKSFHDDAGGGGPQSNMYLVPYLLFYGIYILLHVSFTREDKALASYLEQKTPNERWLECAYEAEGPFYLATLSLALQSPSLWKANRILHLKRMLVLAHARHMSPAAVIKSLADKSVLDYTVYKPAVMMWAIIDKIYTSLLGTMVVPRDEDHTMALFDFIRRNDELMLKRADIIRNEFTTELQPCTSFAEFCDMADLLGEIADPEQFLVELIGSLPSCGPAPTA